MKILCLGDSITWGAWDSHGGWTARIRHQLDEMKINGNSTGSHFLYNLGISSDTSRRVLDRIEAETHSHSLEEGELAFLISLGTNDSVWFRDRQSFWLSIEEFENNMSAIADLALQHASKVAFVGSARVDENKTHPYTYDHNLESSNEDIRRYDLVTRRVAETKNVEFVEIFDRFTADDPAVLLFPDGVHPNDQGHELIAKLIWPTVDRWLSDISAHPARHQL